MGGIKLSIVLPCYNEVRAVPGIFQAFRKVHVGYAWELVIVDNGSTDGTGKAVLNEVSKPENAFAMVVTVEKNLGYGFGILQGLKACRGDVLAWSHADLQTPVEDVFRAYERLAASDRPRCSMVKGRRRGRPLPDRMVTAVMGLIASIVLFARLWDVNAQPKVFSRNLYERFNNPPNDFNLDLYAYYLARRCGYRVETVPVVFEKRPFGLSKWATGFGSRVRFMRSTLAYIFHLRAERP